jgi:hypothetical protein
VAGGVHDEVPPPGPVGDVLAGVVDDLVGADRTDQLQLGGAGDPGHPRAGRLGQLDRVRADPAGRPDDQDPLPWLDLADVAERLEGGDPGDGHDPRLLEADPCRLVREVVRRRAGVLGVGAVGPAEDLVARLEPGHVGTDRLHGPGDVHAPDPDLGPAQPEADEADQVRQARHDVPHAPVQAGGVDPHQHLVVAGHRPVDVGVLQRLEPAVAVLDDGLHGGPPVRGGGRSAGRRRVRCIHGASLPERRLTM